METNQPHRPTHLPSSMRQPSSNVPHHNVPAEPPQHRMQPSKQRSMGFWAVLTGLVLVALVMGWFVVRIATGQYNELAIKNGQYQAVFLSNNMVYFGKLSNVDGSYAKLTNIYYLQVQNQGQQATQASSTTSASQQLSLAKLGSELHGPEDAMYIDRRSILFWENLQNNGKVVQAIKDYQSKNNIK